MKNIQPRYKQTNKQTNNKGFSLVEIIVIVAIMIVLLAVLTPSLLRYVENSRMQKDESAMDEVCNAIQLALSDSAAFDEACAYAIPNNYVTYTDSSGVYGTTIIDEEFWAPDGSGYAITITFNPDENGTCSLAEGIINDMTYGNGSVADARVAEGVKQCYFSEMGDGKLYHKVEQTFGSTFSGKSATYNNSSYTVFITFDVVNGIKRADVYGEWNGTNLSPDCPASLGSGTNSYTEEEEPEQTKTGGTTQSNFTNSDLSGGGSVGSNTTPSYKGNESVVPEHKFDNPNDMTCNDCQQVFTPYTFIAAEYDAQMGTTTQTDSSVTIPETFECDGAYYKVNKIGAEAFWDCGNLTSVTIPNSVVEIDNMAFCRSALRNVTIPDSVKRLGERAFLRCAQLENITLSKNLKTIEYETFARCSALKGITLPDGLQTIDERAFQYCSGLNTIDIPDSVTRIIFAAFADCTSLKSVKLPSNIETLELSIFSGCSSLTNVVIPDSVTRLDDEVFFECSSLGKITLKNVTSVGQYAFYNSGVTEIDMPKVQLVFPGAFYCAESLTSVNMPAVQAIGWEAFDHTPNLSSVVWGSDIAYLEGRTFSYSGLKTITVPDGVVMLPEEFFSDSELENIYIPVSVTAIDAGAFNYCPKLQTINYAGTIEQWKNISKGDYWHGNTHSASFEIVCSDGVINKYA